MSTRSTNTRKSPRPAKLTKMIIITYATKKHFLMLLESHLREQREEGQSSIPQEIGNDASSIITNLFLEDKDVESKASQSELKAVNNPRK